jgi:rhamnopyranosyl-N-acetylglucosaminyl-diphospho-decaprenol beta-1,3/1,4-galactofuranosyltransferase
MENKEMVCAVVVTYNRKDLLIECLDALTKQTRPIDAMYILDNFSNDGTAELLLENGYINELPLEDTREAFEMEIDYNNDIFLGTFDDGVEHRESKIDQKIKIYYVRMNENTGGAGGFYEGQKRAYDRGFDWLWLMDDDGYAPENCLETILKDAKKNDLKVINPLVVSRIDNTKLSFGLAVDMMNTKETIEKSDKNGLIYDKANPFNGTFLHKDVMAKCGFIKKEMFIWGDETEYFLRIKKFGFNYATTCNVKYFHPDSKTVMQSALFGLFSIQTKPEKLEMNYYRNIGYLNGEYEKNLNIKFLIKYFLFFISKGQFSKFIKFIKYFFDGRNNTYKLPKFQ